jgi:hypothetical protein
MFCQLSTSRADKKRDFSRKVGLVHQGKSGGGRGYKHRNYAIEWFNSCSFFAH